MVIYQLIVEAWVIQPKVRSAFFFFCFYPKRKRSNCIFTLHFIQSPFQQHIYSTTKRLVDGFAISRRPTTDDVVHSFDANNCGCNECFAQNGPFLLFAFANLFYCRKILFRFRTYSGWLFTNGVPNAEVFWLNFPSLAAVSLSWSSPVYYNNWWMTDFNECYIRRSYESGEIANKPFSDVHTYVLPGGK